MNFVYTLLLCAAFAVIELLIGGTRLLFSLPAYLILAAAGVLSLTGLRRARMLPDRWCLGSSLLFFGYVLCRAVVSPYAYIARADEFMVLGALIVYLLITCHVTDPHRRLWILAFLLLLGLGNLVVGARQFVENGNYMLFGFLRSAQYTGRASGFYICPDHLAFLLEVVGCLSLSVAIWGRARAWIRLVFGYGAVALFGGLLITASRGGFLSAAAGLAVLALLGLMRLSRSAPHQMARAVGIILVAATLAGVGVRMALSHNAMLKDRAQQLVTMQDVRPRLWKAGYAEFRLSPVFGTGASTYLYYGRRLRDPSVQADPIRTHNDYLELLAEYGAVGAAGLLLFVGAHVWAGWKAYRHFSLSLPDDSGPTDEPEGSNATAWNIGSLSAVAVIAAHSVVDFNLHIPANALLAAFVFGALANPGRSLDSARQEPASRLRWPDYLPRLALPLLGMSIFVAGAPQLPGEYYCEKARVALRDHHSLDASRFALRGLVYETGNPQLYYYLGEARLSLAGDGPDAPLPHSFRLGADEAYRRGLALAPCDTALLLRHAQLLTIFGNYAEAGQVIAQALLWDPNSSLVQTYYGFYLQHSGQLSEAKQAYARAMQLNPNSAAATGLEEISKLGLQAN